MCNNELWSIETNQHWILFIPIAWIIWIEESSFSYIYSFGSICMVANYQQGDKKGKQMFDNELWSVEREIHIGPGSFQCYESLELKDLPSLTSIQLDRYAFNNCHSIVFESMNDWMNDELDLNQLQSITLEYGALYGDCETKESNELIMKSMNDKDGWLIRSPFPIFIQRNWQFLWYTQSDIG